VALCVLWLAGPAWGQAPPAVIGKVNGPAGEALSGVTARLIPEGPEPFILQSTTDPEGEFQFVGVAPGLYEVEVKDAKHRHCREPGFEVGSGSTVDVSIEFLSFRGCKVRATRREAGWGTVFGALARRQLPDARNLWSLLESQEPSTVTNRLDVGGLESGVPALFGALGASWTENTYTLNGFDLTDPYVPGRPLFEPEDDALAEFQVLTGVKPAALAGSGISLVLATREPWGPLHGTTRLFYSGRGTSSDNMNARLRQSGFPGPERLNHLVDGSVQLDGHAPWPTLRWPFFVALSTQQLSKDLGGFAAPIDVHVYRGLVDFSPLSRGPNRLDLLYAGQHVFNSREGASLGVAPSATTQGNDNFHQVQGRWRRSAGPSRVLVAGFGMAQAIVSSGLQPGLTGASTLDLPLLMETGPAPLASAGLRTRYEGNGLYMAMRDGPWGSHSLNAGADWSRSAITNRWDALGGIAQTLVHGAGAEVTRWNTPTQARQHVQNVAFSVQDSWRPARRLSLPLGLRVETSSGQAAKGTAGIRWTTLEPRAGLVFALNQRGSFLRASWSRYGHLLQGRYLDFGDPGALGGQVFKWQDANGDGHAQPGEFTSLRRVFGGPYSAHDRGLARPFTDEISVGLDQDFGPRFRASARFFRRDDHRLVGLTNLGVPLTDYSAVQVVDPGNDGIPGNADDQVLTLYNRNPAALGRDFLLLTNPPGRRASTKGFEIRLVKPLAKRWEFSASFSAMRTLAATSPGNSVLENDSGFLGPLGADPNTLLFDTSRTYFDRAFIGKATGLYRAPHQFDLSAVVKYYDGLPFGRLLFVDGFNQGPFFVRATPRGHPGGFQTQFNFTLDTHLAREFKLPRDGEAVAAYLDVFNALNMSRNTLESDLTGPAFQSRVPLTIESPRVARLGLELRF